MGGRFSYSTLDSIAKAHDVRIIHADRPGIGGSDAVEIEKRIGTYIGIHSPPLRTPESPTMHKH